MADKKTYWASEVQSKDAVAGAIERVRRYQKFLTNSGRAWKARRAWSAYYGQGPSGDRDSSQLLPGGVQGELVVGASNLFAALVQQMVVMTTSSKPAFTAVANNTDFKSMAQAQLANGLLESYDRRIDLAEHERLAVFLAVLMYESWVVQEWDKDAGDETTVDMESGKPVREGDVKASTYTLFDVAYDTHNPSTDKLSWICIRRVANKYDLAAKYPKVGDKLISKTLDSGAQEISDRIWLYPSQWLMDSETDCIAYWELRHLPSPACPNGRHLIYVDGSCIMHDSMSVDAESGEVQDFGYPYEQLYAFCLRPEKVAGVGIGHTNIIDLLNLQEALDMAVSSMMTNVNALAVKNLWLKPGSNFSPEEAAGGLNIIQSESKPETIELAMISPDVLKFMDVISQGMLRRVGMSNVTLGEPERNMPAQLAALIESKSVQFNSSLQAAYAQLVERSRGGVLSLLKEFATTKRVALMAGKANSWMLKEFSAEDLKSVERVTVEQVNPASQTVAGKRATAQELLQAGLVRNPEEYVTLITTGKLEPVYAFAQVNTMRIKKDMERLQNGIGLPPVQMDANGQPVMDDKGLPVFVDAAGEFVLPYIYDTHWLDIPEYLTVIATPGARENPAVLKAVTEVINFKQQLWSLLSVDEQKMLQCPEGLIRMPPEMMAPPMPPDAPPMPPDMPAPEQPKQPLISGLPPGAPPIRAPKPPPNPQTGTQAPPPVV